MLNLSLCHVRMLFIRLLVFRSGACHVDFPDFLCGNLKEFVMLHTDYYLQLLLLFATYSINVN